MKTIEEEFDEKTHNHYPVSDKPNRHCKACKTIEEDFDEILFGKEKIIHGYTMGETLAIADLRREIKSFIRRAIEKARQEERERIEKIIENVIQEERFAGAPYALNKVKEIIRKK